jgi:hypothetical protein
VRLHLPRHDAEAQSLNQTGHEKAEHHERYKRLQQREACLFALFHFDKIAKDLIRCHYSSIWYQSIK